MTLTVEKRALKGKAVAPASKSVLHRLLICAALSDKPTTLTDCSLSQDIVATAECLQALGASIKIEGSCIMVNPLRKANTSAWLDCGESGSTLRFLLPIAAALGGATFTGRGRLAQRPLSPLYELLSENGCTLTPNGTFPLTVTGRLAGESFSIDGGVSSQFISGLLLAAPLLGSACTVTVTGAVESRPYIDLTIAAMRHFGVEVVQQGNTFTVPCGKGYRSPETMAVEGDWSNGAFWLVAGAISPNTTMTVGGLDERSLQGDREIVSILRGVGAVVEQQDGALSVKGGSPFTPFRVDVAQIPDLVPILAVLAAAIPGCSRIENARRLRLKESDRLSSVHAMLTALGGTVTLGEDFLVIHGTGRLAGGTVDACNDHRIAMAAAVASCLCERSVKIVGAEAVSKSYPTFFREFAERGMKVCPPYSGKN